MFSIHKNLKYTTLKSKDNFLDNFKKKIFWNKELGIISSRNEYSFKEYEGYVENNSFTIRRILKIGANSFIPLIHGIIIKNNDNESIDIQLKIVLQKLTRMFLLVFNIFLSILIILLIIAGNIISFVSLVFFILIFFSYISINFLFELEAKKADKFFKELL